MSNGTDLQEICISRAVTGENYGPIAVTTHHKSTDNKRTAVFPIMNASLAP